MKRKLKRLRGVLEVSGSCLLASSSVGLMVQKVHSQENDWIADVAIPSQNDGVGGGESGTQALGMSILSFSSEAEVERYAEETRQKWNRILGAFEIVPQGGREEHRRAPKLEVLEEKHLDDGLVQRRVRYETEPGEWVEAFYLAKKDLPEKSPGVIVFHSTFRNSIHQCVGGVDPKTGQSPDEHEMRKAYALHLAKRGFVTLSPRNYLWTDNETMDLRGESKRFLERNPARKGMARMLLDAILAVDVLASLPGVDTERLGAIGHSLGAKESLYVAAFDPRIRAAVSSEGGIGIRQSNWEADWYLGGESKSPEFKLDHHQLVAAIAPRPFLVIGGNASDGAETLPYLQAALPAYQAYGLQSHLGFFNHAQGHSVPPESLARSLQWLEVHLKQ